MEKKNEKRRLNQGLSTGKMKYGITEANVAKARHPTRTDRKGNRHRGDRPMIEEEMTTEVQGMYKIIIFLRATKGGFWTS